MEKNEHYFYVLECADKSFYAGYTNNLYKRLATHNAGKGAKYTKSRIPVEIKYKEVFQSKSEALQAEYRFKQLTRKEKEQYIKEGLKDDSMDTK